MPTELRHIAVVDPGSSVLAFDYYFCRSHLAQGSRVTVLASETRYNAEFLSELAREDGVEVKLWPVSSTVAGRFRGPLNYLKLLLFLLLNSYKFETIYYNFPKSWILESVLFRIISSKIVYCVHNSVPHNFAKEKHFGTSMLASSAERLLFVSHWSKRDFISRYGKEYDEVSDVLQHGIMGIDPHDAPRSYKLTAQFCGVAFWGNIKPYKGIELFRVKAKAWLPPEVEHRYLIAGKWDSEIAYLRNEYRSRREITLRDGFLSRDEVKELLADDFVFILPYRQASQSGILYTLLFYGRYFLATDQGDIGEFLKVNGLQELIIADFGESEMRRAIGWLIDNLFYVQTQLNAAQQAYRWQISNEELAISS